MLTLALLLLVGLTAHSLWDAVQQAPFGREDSAGFSWSETFPWQTPPAAMMPL